MKYLKIIKMQALLLICFAFIPNITFSQNIASEGMEVMIPLYQEPYLTYNDRINNTNFKWQYVVNAAEKVDLVVIINPGNGPTSNQGTVDNFTAGIRKLNEVPNIKVYGYVATDRLNKSSASIKAEIDLYYSQTQLTDSYSLDGIFFDEVATANTTANLTGYRDLYSHVTGKEHVSWKVMLNPGTRPLADYLDSSNPAANIVVNFENYYSGLSTMTQNTGDRKKYGAIIHSLPFNDIPKAKESAETAFNNNYGFVFVTDDQFLPNPFDNSPLFWYETVEHIKRLNHPITSGHLINALVYNNWRNRQDASDLSVENRRNTLIVELSLHSNQSGGVFQEKTNEQLTSYAATIGALIYKFGRTKTYLATRDTEWHRNELISVINQKHPHMSVGSLQAMNNFQLASIN